MKMKRLKFFDVRVRKSFFSSNYKTVPKVKKGFKTIFAVAESPFTGKPCYRILKGIKIRRG